MSIKCNLLGGTPALAGRGPGLGTADHPFDLTAPSGLSTWPAYLFLRNFVDVRLRVRTAARIDAEVAIELGGKLGETDRIVVEHGDVAGRLIGDVHVVALVDQADQRAAHRDHVVVRMRREDEHPLGENVVVRPATIARRLRVIGLAARPAGDRRLQCAKDSQVDVVRRAYAWPAGPAAPPRCSLRR